LGRTKVKICIGRLGNRGKYGALTMPVKGWLQVKIESAQIHDAQRERKSAKKGKLGAYERKWNLETKPLKGGKQNTKKRRGRPGSA